MFLFINDKIVSPAFNSKGNPLIYAMEVSLLYVMWLMILLKTKYKNTNLNYYILKTTFFK